MRYLIPVLISIGNPSKVNSNCFQIYEILTKLKNHLFVFLIKFCRHAANVIDRCRDYRFFLSEVDDNNLFLKMFNYNFIMYFKVPIQQIPNFQQNVYCALYLKAKFFKEPRQNKLNVMLQKFEMMGANYLQSVYL